jgi:3-phosphoglycerate kinase
MVPIVQKDNEILRKVAKEVAISDIGSPKIKKILSDMKIALDSQEDGVAIAAPQIGVSLRIFVVSEKALDIPDKKEDRKKRVKDPKKVLYRSPHSILEPDEWYENDWKPGVVYVCGAVLNGNQVFVYYGGGDKHTCLATANLDELINFIKGKSVDTKIFKKIQ